MAAAFTPPGSVRHSPLTPPYTAGKSISKTAQSVLNCLRLHQIGRRPKTWWEYQIRPTVYAQILLVLDADDSLRHYVEDKVRFDYDPCRHSLAIRMPSPLHDTFCARLVDEISDQIKQFQHDDSIIDFVKDIKHFATSRILIPEDTPDGNQTYSRHEPDASFGHRQAHYPGVVIEVCYSQKSQCISHLADEYILNTDGSVNVVIAFDIDYKGSKRATITVWRPEYILVDDVEEFRATAVIEARPFRTETGCAVEGTELRLPLRDFGTDELSHGQKGLDQEIILTSNQLCQFLASAEARQNIQTQHQGSINRIRPGALKRRRPQTPPEHLSEEESSIEMGREKKRGRQSSDFRPGSSSGDSNKDLH